MTTFALEIGLILVGAFAVGCIVGCVSRDRLGAGRQSGSPQSDKQKGMT